LYRYVAVLQKNIHDWKVWMIEVGLNKLNAIDP
jgi:hypothetical protein